MSMAQLQLTPALLAEMIGLIDADTISGKIAKQILPDLLAVRALNPRPCLVLPRSQAAHRQVAELQQG